MGGPVSFVGCRGSEFSGAGSHGSPDRRRPTRYPPPRPMANSSPDSRSRPREGEARAGQVREIFSSIAPRYDLLNRLLSATVDRRWRRLAVDRLLRGAGREGRILDACAGTMDVADEVASREGFRGRVVACDFALPMLVEGLGKVAGAPAAPVCGDALSLPFPSRVFDGAIVAFGVRNLADLDVGLRELSRVLRPEGTVVLLEFTLPRNPVLRRLYLFYFTRLLPWIGRLVSGHGWAYRYLPESVLEFPEPPALGRRMEDAGFDGVEWRLLTGGIAAIHAGVRGGARTQAGSRSGSPPVR